MARRPTISDLAKASGVSVATVDRVLNGRTKVRPETTRRVLEAAQEIGYHGTSLIEHRLTEDLPSLRLGVVLYKEKQAFFQNLKSHLIEAAEAATGVRCQMDVVFSPSQNPEDFARLLEELSTRCDAVAASAVTHVEVTDAVERIQAKGVPCFAILNDFAQGIRTGYLGMNNLKVGRIAAHIIAATVHRPGKVAVFVGGARWHGHELREAGFRSYFREYAPQFTILDTLINLETRQLTHEAMLDLLARHPDLSGVYCAGGGMEGAIAALREAARAGQVPLVVNELTPESRLGLADHYVSLVLSTPLRKLCDALIEQARAAVSDPLAVAPAQHFMPPDLYLPESV